MCSGLESIGYDSVLEKLQDRHHGTDLISNKMWIGNKDGE
jgi:hypothetical protein